MAKKKKEVSPVLREALGDLGRTYSDLLRARNSLERKIESINKKLELQRAKKAKIREKLALMTQKERDLMKVKNVFRTRSKSISERLKKVVVLGKDLKGL